jgi:hypothetical protein
MKLDKKIYLFIFILLTAIGLLFIWEGKYLIEKYTNKNLGNFDFANRVLASIYYFTAIIILWYTKETYDIKKIQSEQIEELRKTRYLQKMPIIKLVSMELKKKKKGQRGEQVMTSKGLRVYDPETWPEEQSHFYEYKYKNIGEDWAFIKKIIVWIGNPSPEKEILLNKKDFRKNLFRDEEDRIFIDKIEIKSADKPIDKIYLFPQKIKIFYSDRYGNEFIYTAKRSSKQAEPTPFLGMDDYFEEEVIYPPNLK